MKKDEISKINYLDMAEISFNVQVALFFTLLLCLALVVLGYLMYLSRLIGWIAGKLVTWLYLGENEEVEFGSLGFSLLGGKINAHRIVFRDKNVAVLILQATVTLNWWETTVKQRSNIDNGFMLRIFYFLSRRCSL